MSYFRITHKAKTHGYWIDIELEGMPENVKDILLKYRNTVIGKDHEWFSTFIQALLDDPTCPPIFKQADPIQSIHIEYRTTTPVRDWGPGE